VTPTALRLVVARAGDSSSTDTLLALAAALAGDDTFALEVLMWLSGPQVDRFAALGPTVDGGAVDRWLPARALQLAGLHRVAQAVKTPRLRRLLAGLRDPEITCLGGLGAVAYLAWVPASPQLVIQIGDDDLDGPWADDERTARAVRSADVVVATGEPAARWAVDKGAEPDRLARYAFLTDRDTGVGRPGPAGLPLVGLVNFGADQVGAVVADLALAAQARGAAFRWYGRDRPDWSLWQGRGSPPTHHVETAPAEDLRADLGHLRVLVHPIAAPVAGEVQRLSAARGVALLGIDPRVPIGPAFAAAIDRDGDRPAESGWTLTAEDAMADLRQRLRGTGPERPTR
jgi:hypothetical protein